MIGSYLSQTCTLYAPGPSDAEGNTTYPAGVEQKCRLEQRHTLVRTLQGDEVVSAGRMFLLANSGAVADARVLFSGRTFRVVSVEVARGLDADSHLIAYLL